ncbi:hypothetical protein BGP_3907 [Beggiatoa sp. PS]|nr:hypothetical protein BGP_3907 [Beggiatoa sp. PS]
MNFQNDYLACRFSFACEFQLQPSKMITPKCWTSYCQSNLRTIRQKGSNFSFQRSSVIFATNFYNVSLK